MKIELTPHAEEVLLRHLSSGEFSSPTDVIEQALNLFDAQGPTLASLKAKIQVGLDELAAGNVAPLDIREIKRHRAQIDRPVMDLSRSRFCSYIR